MRVVVAMSGGVDSSVAALRLREAGHEVLGVFLRNGVVAESAIGPTRGCCSVRDACDAEEVAGRLDIPFYSLDHSREFGRIVDDFVAEYAAGRTPNPCVQCNRELKFGELMRFADTVGAEAVASGHYARLEVVNGRPVLRRAVDLGKDQSYVLATSERDSMARVLFPLGELQKPEVRALAERAGLAVHDKVESQDICFIPSGDHRDLLRRKRPELFRSGPIVDREGRVLGQHGGAVGFTVGQRRGIGLGGNGPFYVLETDPESNVVTVGRREELPLFRAELRAVQWWIPTPCSEGEGLEVTAQLRAHHAGDPARVLCSGDRVELEFAQGAVVVPGQIGVLYDGDRVVAAGTMGQAVAANGR